MSKKNSLTNQIVFSMVIYVLTYSIVFRQTTMGLYTDYYLHLQCAAHYESECMKLTYPIWHILVWLCLRIVNLPVHLLHGGAMEMSGSYACAFVSAMVNVGVYLLTTGYLRKKKIEAAELIGLAICLVGPMNIPWIHSDIYFGVGTPNTWHNPTNLMVKPFALLGFWGILEI